MPQFNRFEFEQQLLKCWTVTDMVNSVTEGTLDHGWNPDQISNALIGIKEIYELEFNKLFGMFERGISEKAISDPVTISDN